MTRKRKWYMSQEETNKLVKKHKEKAKAFLQDLKNTTMEGILDAQEKALQAKKRDD